MSDVDKYPHILDISKYVWHRRPAGDPSDGPTYPTRCGTTVTTGTVDIPEGPTVDDWESLCENGCYS
jgi:hypothetical protein